MKDRSIKIVKLSHTDDQTKADAVALFLDCFPVYGRISKNRRILKEFFLSSFDFDLCYAAMEDTEVVGFISVCNARERSLKFKKATCTALLGWAMGTITYRQMMLISGRPNLDGEHDVGIDYLATDARCRGKGIATGLLEYACETLCRDECFLDVAATNPTAKRLYEHLGFREYAQNRGVINRLLGFGYIIRLKKLAGA